MSTDTTAPAPSFSPSPMEMAPSIDVAAPALEVTNDGLAYAGPMEWTVADQAAFEGAVAENRAEITEQYSWSTSPYTENLLAAQEYLHYESANNDAVPPPEATLLERLLTDTSAIEHGVWLSDLTEHAPGDTELSPELEASRVATIKCLASELGLGVEDVEVERDDMTLIDAFIHSYALAELPEQPYRLKGEYVCEGEVISAKEARRIQAARELAEEVGDESLTRDLGEMMVEAHDHFKRNVTLLINIPKPNSHNDSITATAEKTDILITSPQKYVHLKDTKEGEGEIYLTKLDSPEENPLPHVEHVVQELEGYDVEDYEFAGFTRKGGVKYKAILDE